MPVAFLNSVHPIPWYRQFPGGKATWNDWDFVFEDTGEDYDYLIVFDDLSAPLVPRCSRKRTIHVATEPVSVMRYSRNFTDQFSICLTMDRDLRHPNRILTQPGLNWFIGWDPQSGAAPGAMSFRALETLFDEPRTKLISMISSNKSFTGGHKLRLQFVENLKAHFGGRIDFYGRGFRPMIDKIEAVRNYRFHVVLENTQAEYYFSEKLSDCLIAGCYPIYAGCKNIDLYLPPLSFAAIDMNEPANAIDVIENAIEKDFDQLYREQLREGRRRIMFEHNLFPMLSHIMSDHMSGRLGFTDPVATHGQAMLPYSHPEFIKLFGPKRRQSLRTRVSEAADSFPPLDFVRSTVRKVRRYL